MATPAPGVGFAIRPVAKDDKQYDFTKDGEQETRRRVEVIPMQDRYKPLGRQHGLSEAEILRRDLASLPDESYTVDPADIGVALLRGMLPSWTPGQKLAESGLPQPIEFMKRDFRLGLGADPELPPTTRKRKGPKDKTPALVVPEDETGRRRSFKFLDERLVKRRKLGPHAAVLILRGPHRDMCGTVVRWEDTAPDAAVALDLNRTEVTVPKGDLRLADREDYLRLSSTLQQSLRPAAPSPVFHDVSDDEDPAPCLPPVLRPEAPRHPPPLTWVRRRLYVRVIARGPHYTHKGHVYDIVGEGRCAVRMDDGTLVDGLGEAELETVVPKQAGQSVMIVRGKYQGQVAKVHSRDPAAERCILQIDTRVETRPFDDICLFLED